MAKTLNDITEEEFSATVAAFLEDAGGRAPILADDECSIGMIRDALGGSYPSSAAKMAKQIAAGRWAFVGMRRHPKGGGEFKAYKRVK
jgi:hypothetical protein